MLSFPGIQGWNGDISMERDGMERYGMERKVRKCNIPLEFLMRGTVRFPFPMLSFPGIQGWNGEISMERDGMERYGMERKVRRP